MNLKIKLFLFLVFCLYLAKAQDKVVKNDGTVVEVKAVEQTWSVLKYRMTDYSDGPVLWMPLAKIKKIEYQNGVVDHLASLNPRMCKPFSVGIDLALLEEGSFVPFLEAGYFISPQIEFSAQFFTDLRETMYLAVGPKVHFSRSFSTKMVTPFVGFLVGNDSGTAITKIPVGANMASKKGLNVSLSYNMIQYWYADVQQLYSLEMGIGWRF
jgi:hypothetical protein